MNPIHEAGTWVYKMIFTFVIAVVVIFVISASIKEDPNTRDVQEGLLLNRILYSPDSVWLTDSSGTVYPGIVDKTAFTDKRLSDNFQYVTGYGGARITLIEGQTSTTRYINEGTFKTYYNNYKAGIKNGGRVSTHNYPVVIDVKGTRSNGFLVIDIAVPEET